MDTHCPCLAVQGVAAQFQAENAGVLRCPGMQFPTAASEMFSLSELDALSGLDRTSPCACWLSVAVCLDQLTQVLAPRCQLFWTFCLHILLVCPSDSWVDHTDLCESKQNRL